MMVNRKQLALAAAVMSVALVAQATAAEYTWTPTAGGTSYDWNAATSNWGGGFPKDAGDVANLNNNIAGAQTIRLQQNISIGTLNLGDSDGVSAFTINSGTGTNLLSLQSATAGGATYLNMTGAGAGISNIIAANAAVGGTSSLSIYAAGSQNLQTNGTFNTNPANNAAGNQISLSGGTAQRAIWTISGDLLGNGTITTSGAGGVFISGAKSFTGTFVVNSGTNTSSNTGGLSINSGSVANASEVIVNGYLSGTGSTQNGGIFWSGNNSAASTNPGQRFTTHTVTLNGGNLGTYGQTASAVLAADVGTGTGTDTAWRRGEEWVTDNIATIKANSGQSIIAVGVGGNTKGTVINVGTMQRSAGATVYAKGGSLGNITGTGAVAKLLFGNSGDFLIGSGASATSRKIIPWMVAGNSNTPDSFATYDTNGVRVLNTSTEYAALSGGTASADNVSTNTTTALSSATTVNSLRYTGGSAFNLGTGQTLTVSSGGVLFTSNGGAIGAAGNAAAGTLAFGAAEGVIWANDSTRTNTVGAVISGTGGLTKSGTGTLVLAGDNIYSGLTTVSSGVLQVASNSDLGSGDVLVANGALLRLLGSGSIDDSATISLQQFGLYNGKIELAAGINDTVGALYFGSTQQAFGTWGATGSGADNINNTFFSGTGVLNVVAVPEPATLGAMAVGLLALMRRQRRA